MKTTPYERINNFTKRYSVTRFSSVRNRAATFLANLKTFAYLLLALNCKSKSKYKLSALFWARFNFVSVLSRQLAAGHRLVLFCQSIHLFLLNIDSTSVACQIFILLLLFKLTKIVVVMYTCCVDLTLSQTAISFDSTLCVLQFSNTVVSKF